MSFQTEANVKVVVRRETAINVQATTTGATVMRYIKSPGLDLKRANILSQEKRTDGLTPMGRLGGKSVTGDFTQELVTGGVLDLFTEALMRSTWTPAVNIGFATVTTVAFGTNYLSIASGDLVGAQGVRVGDIFVISGSPTVGNNNVNAQVVAVSSLTITTATGVFATQVATATGTITLLKKVITSDPAVRYSHTVEEYNTDIDQTELFTGVRVVGAKFSFKPGQMATVQWTLMGIDRQGLTTAASPYFTSPTTVTGLAMIADDSTIRYNGAAVASFTGFELEFKIAAKGEPVIGSFISPDIFDNNLEVSGTITALRQDLSNLTLFDAETEFEIHIMLQDPSSTPKGVYALHLPRVKISGLSAPAGGGDGAKVETLTLMTGPKVAATGYDGTIATISSSAP